MAKHVFKTIPFKMLGGVLDTRSIPDDMPDGAVRWRQNFAILDNRKVCRRDGFQKLFSTSPYNNEDLHDQLLSLQTYYDDLDPKDAGADHVIEWPSALCDGALQTRTAGREPINLLHDATSTTGRRLLYAGTPSRLYVFSEFAKTWRIIGDNFNASSYYWKASTNNDVVVFTNNQDQPVYHVIGQHVSGCDQQAVEVIDDLVLAGVTRARVVVEWKGLTLLMNLMQNGVSAPNRIIWSDWRKPLSYIPAADSVAGTQDLGSSEEILAALPLGDELVVYTNIGIWRISSTGNTDTPLAFFQAYSSRLGDMCLAYPNAITSNGSVHFFMGHKGVNIYSTTLPQPEEVGWIHQCTDIVYDDIEEDCHQPIMEYHFPRDEVYLSWPQLGESQNSRTLAINIKPQHQAVDVIDHGFTAIVNHRRDTRMTIGEFLLTYGICTTEDLVGVDMKIGCEIESPDPVCAVNSIWNEAEDFAEDADSDSLCECIGDLSLSELCDRCEGQPALIAASAQDYCLKEMHYNTSREICSNPTDEGEVNESGCYISPQGTYTYTGYYSIIRLGPLSLGKPEIEKLITRIMIEAYPEYAITPGVIRLALGCSRSAYDPNQMTDRTAPYHATTNQVGSGCGVLWSREDDKDFECWESETAEELKTQNLKPGLPIQWEVYEQDNFLYLEIAIANSNGSAATTGAGCLSRIEIKVQPKEYSL